MKQTTKFTKARKEFFNTPRTQAEINTLFNGDEFAVNNFLNANIMARLLEFEIKDGFIYFQNIGTRAENEAASQELDALARYAQHG